MHVRKLIGHAAHASPTCVSTTVAAYFACSLHLCRRRFAVAVAAAIIGRWSRSVPRFVSKSRYASACFRALLRLIVFPCWAHCHGSVRSHGNAHQTQVIAIIDVADYFPRLRLLCRSSRTHISALVRKVGGSRCGCHLGPPSRRPEVAPPRSKFISTPVG